MAAFPEIGKIPYEGPQSKNPLAYRHYNADEKIEGKTMRDHLRFSVVSTRSTIATSPLKGRRSPRVTRTSTRS
jgi:xylose isomerase